VGGLADHLLVLLIFYRCAIMQDFMDCLYQTNKSSIRRSLNRIEPLHGVSVSNEAFAFLMKRHTLKTEAVITKKGKIASLSKSAPGRGYEFKIRRRGPLCLKIVIFTLLADIKVYKKTRARPLTKDERAYNHALNRS